MNEFRFICARLILDERVLKILSVTERHTGESDDILIQSLKENAIHYIKVSGIPSGNKLIKTMRYLHM